MIDIHSHIINNIDDGSKSIETSIKMLENLSSHGITNIVFTPHFILDSDFEYPYEKKKKLYDNLVKRIKKEKINIKTYLGNEIYINKDIKEYISKNKLMINKTKYILLEFPLNGEYNNSYGIISGLIEKGYKVILAHPERYTTVQKDITVLDEYKNLGVLFQSNVGSLFGMYGRKAKSTIKKLLKKEYVSFLGTDIHHNRYNYSYLDKLNKKLKRIISEEYMNNLIENNAKKMLKGEDI